MDKRMNEKEKCMLEEIRPERHISAMMTLATIKFIKDECNKNERCSTCKFYARSAMCCCFHKEEYDTPSEWDEYDLTERIYK